MHWLFERPTPSEANHWLAILSLVLFAAGVVASSYLATKPGLPPFRGHYTQKFVTLCCTMVGWISGVGLFFGFMRLLQVDPVTLGRGIWILLSWILLVIAVVWLVQRAPADREQRRQNDAILAQKQGKKKQMAKAGARN